MALPALIQAAIARIRGANNNMWDAVTNPLGHGQGGHRQNFIPDMNAVADISLFVVDQAVAVDADATQTAADRVQTGKDVVTTGQSRDKAQLWANAPEDQEVESGKFSALHFVRKAAAQVVLAAAQVALAAGKVTDAAAEVTKAATQADRSKTEADRAKGYANGLNIPSLNPSTASKFLRANAAGDAYEFGEISAATTPDIIVGTGKGFANAETLGPILSDIRPSVGDLLESLKVSGTGSANWLECNGSVLLKASYPDLFGTIGQRYLDFAALSSVGLTTAQPIYEVVWLDSFTFINQYAGTPGDSSNRFYYSTDDGATLTQVPLGATSTYIAGASDIIKFKGYYVFLPDRIYSSAVAAYCVGMISADGRSWTNVTETGTGQNVDGLMSYATDGSTIFGARQNSTILFRKTSATVPFAPADIVNTPSTISSNALKKAIAYGNGVLVVVTNGGAYWSTNGGTTWTACASASWGSNADSQISFFNGKFYIFTQGTGKGVHVSSDGKTFSVLFTLAAVAPQMDNGLSYMANDGERFLLVSGNGTLYALDMSTLVPYKLNPPNTITSIVQRSKNGFRAGDGLVINNTNSPSTGVRMKYAANKATEFMLPVLAGRISLSKMFIRSKAA